MVQQQPFRRAHPGAENGCLSFTAQLFQALTVVVAFALFLVFTFFGNINLGLDLSSVAYLAFLQSTI